MIVEYYGTDQCCLVSTMDVLNCLLSKTNKKVGIINWWWLNSDQADLKNLKSFVERQDVCFFLSEEIFDKHPGVDVNKVFSLLNRYNVYYILFSEDNTLTVSPDYNKCFYNPWFFKSPLYLKSETDIDLSYKEKPYVFNLMLGSRKSYRSLIFKNLKDNKNIYSSYLGHERFKEISQTFLDDEEIRTDLTVQDIKNHKLNTMNFVLRDGRYFPISHVVPEKIYDNTHFDIVTETFIKGGTRFLTEKTAKPLATGRFFCWYASPGLMDYLGRYGFEFTHYQAEYDKLFNDVDRLEDLLEIINEISSSPSLIKEIYENTEHVRQHNMEVFWRSKTNFYENLQNWMITCIQK